MENILFVLLGLLIGGLIGWIVSQRRALAVERVMQNELELGRRQMSESQREVAVWEEKAKSLGVQLEDLRRELAVKVRENIELMTESTSLREQQIALKEKLDEHKKDIENIQTTFKDQFKVLADQILEEKSTKFAKQNEVNLRLILDPLGERLNEFKKKVEDTYTTEMKERVTLQEQIRQLTELNIGMQEDAKNLTRALKGDSKVQGNWGEVILQRILEKSGLTKDREYRVQVSGQNEEGRRIQPDVIIDLPEGKQLIVDSKVSLVAFEKFSSAETSEERDKAIREHLISVRSHVRGLSEKNYQNMYEINSPDFVLMFIPIEPAFALTLQADQELYNEAIEKNIVLVSPSTLLATLLTIASIWKQENRTRNAVEIASAGGALYDKFVGFTDDLLQLGNRITQAQAEYEKAMSKLKSGKGNLVKRADDLRLLGVKTTKQLNRDLIEDSDEESILVQKLSDEYPIDGE
jgi:DNA recombination protein RmuC